MAHGGKRPGAGRPKGARNIRSEETAKQIEESGLTPLEFLMGIVRDNDASLKERIECARAAAPFVHARLSSVDMDLHQTTRQTIDDYEPDELAEIIKLGKSAA